MLTKRSLAARLRDVAAWLDDRTGIQTAFHHLRSEKIPASSGWRQVFGSVALFLFLVQAFTGILLSFNYAPTSGDAYTSIRYILTEVTAGKLVRGLHHWGASMIVVVVVLHMLQVFLYGAYKKPREVTWICGVALFLCTLAYSLTGYLLPWDNRAYWGTVVTTRIASQAPLAGPYLMRLLGSDGAVTAVTFTRFYELHVLLLPGATILLLSLHLFLVRKHGVAPAPVDENVPKKDFYPGQVFKDTIAIFIAFAVLFTLAVVAHVPLEQLADPSDSSYIPRPEWYFLFLFQTLKLFAGPLEVVGSIVLPSAAILLLLLVPFIDRGRVVAVTKRAVAFAVIVLAGVAWTGLTAAAVATTPKEDGTQIDYSGPTGWLQLAPADLAAIAFFRQETCGTCHGGGSVAGLGLTHAAARKNAAWLVEHFEKRSHTGPRASGSAIPLNDAQLTSLAAFVQQLNPENASALQNAPSFATEGALVYQANHCGSCHTINGAGAAIGPPLNGLSRRRSRSWIGQHFADPKKLTPNTIMPAYKLATEDVTNLTQYLLSLNDIQ